MPPGSRLSLTFRSRNDDDLPLFEEKLFLTE